MGLEQTSLTGQQDGLEKRRKKTHLDKQNHPFLAVFDIFWFSLANFLVDNKHFGWTSGWH